MPENYFLQDIPFLQKLTMETLFNSFYYYRKDLASGYLECNELLAHEFNLASIKDISKVTDFNLGWDSEKINNIRQYDTEVITKGRPVCKLEEPFILPSGKQVKLISHKVPIRDKNANITGIVGISIDINSQSDTAHSLFELHLDSIIGFQNRIYKTFKIHITTREVECLHYLLRGKSAKETGILMGLSRRTIEFYLDTLKEKFYCQKKSELFDCIFNAITYSE